MRIVCTQENLRNGLQVVSRIISSSNTLPILNNVLLKTENGLLKLSATNLEIGITTTVRCKVEEEGEVALPAKPFTDLVNSLPNKNINLEKQTGGVLIQTDNYKTLLKSLPGEDFPVIPIPEKGIQIKMDSQALKKAVDQVIFAASTNETQPEISGLYMLSKEGKMRFVSTDRYRLAEKTITVKNSQDFEGVIIPHRTAVELSRVVGNQALEVEMVITPNQLSVNLGGTEMVSRLIDGQYPDYEQIIPSEFVTLAIVSRSALVGALKISSVFSSTVNSIKLEISPDIQKIKIASGLQDLGQSEVDLDGDVTGPAVSIIFNHRYILDCLNAVDGSEVVFKIINDSAATIITPKEDEGYRYLVMPIKT